MCDVGVFFTFLLFFFLNYTCLYTCNYISPPPATQKTSPFSPKTTARTCVLLSISNSYFCGYYFFFYGLHLRRCFCSAIISNYLFKSYLGFLIINFISCHFSYATFAILTIIFPISYHLIPFKSSILKRRVSFTIIQKYTG